MENKGLLFIPDISGFTQFVSQTDIEHSRLIIQELLEILINSNQIGLEVSEIEGDAILFYKFGNEPDLKEIYSQVEKMFTSFHRYIAAYNLNKFCQCKACLSAINLTLKVVTHYGEFTGYNVKNFSKLIGKDVIVAHQLLKNDIDKHEYWLVTKNLASGEMPSELPAWLKWDSSSRQTESGEIPFQYAQLGQLLNEIPPEPEPDLELINKVKLASASHEYETDIITLFHASGIVGYRSQWQAGVRKAEEFSHFLPRVGMKFKIFTDAGEEMMQASGFIFSQERISFSETNEKKTISNYFTLEQVSDNRIRLTWDYYEQKNFAAQLLFNLFRKSNKEKEMNLSLKKLETVAKTIHLPA